MAALRFATNARPVLLANVFVYLDGETAALTSFAAIKPVLTRSLDMKAFARLGIEVQRLAYA